MDVYCANCREPWDNYHMRHDAIWETDLPESIKKDFDGKLTQFIEDAFKRDGWTFLGSIYAIARCPACKEEKMEGSDERALRTSVISELLANDPDGLVSELNDMENGLVSELNDMENL